MGLDKRIEWMAPLEIGGEAKYIFLIAYPGSSSSTRKVGLNHASSYMVDRFEFREFRQLLMFIREACFENM